MAHDPQSWRGYFAASPTPFTADGKLDLAALEATLQWLLDARPHGLVVNGTTGEWFAQTIEEREQVVQAARRVVPRDLPFLVGISHIDPRESVRLGRHAQAVGADGVLLTIPPARRLTEADIIAFYGMAVAEIALPILIYNVPASVGFDLPPDLMLRLQAIKGVVGIKDNTPSSAARLETLRTLGSGRALFSDVLEPEAFELFVQGFGRGQIGSGMPLGRPLSAAFEHVWAGRTAAARRIVARFAKFKTDALAILPPGQPWHAQIKAMMSASGVDAGLPRFPSRSIRDDSDGFARLRHLMETYLDGGFDDPIT